MKLSHRIYIAIAMVATLALGAYLARWPVLTCVRASVWPSSLLWGTVASDVAIVIAYMWIPVVLVALWRARRDVPVTFTLLCFAAFIVLCGATHFMNIITSWEPVYWLALEVKVFTGAVSLATAGLLHFRVAPLLLTLPSHHQLEEALSAAQAAKTAAETNLGAAESARRFAEEQRLVAQSEREAAQKANGRLTEQADELGRTKDELEVANRMLMEQAGELMEARDSARRRAVEATREAEDRGAQVQSLETMLATILRQEEAIEALSTPVLPVADGVLLLPLVGILDSARAASVTQELLGRVAINKAHAVIIDLAGLQALDTAVAAAILRLVATIALVGARAVITGIRPEVAQTIVSLGIDLSQVATKHSLAQGLELATQWRRGGPVKV